MFSLGLLLHWVLPVRYCRAIRLVLRINALVLSRRILHRVKEPSGKQLLVSIKPINPIVTYMGSWKWTRPAPYRRWLISPEEYGRNLRS